MPLKVLHIIDNLDLGGAQVCVKYLCENHGDDIRNYIYPLRTLQKIYIDAETVKHSRKNYSPFKIWDIIRICHAEKIDIIHTHLKKSAIAGVIASYFTKAKVFVHEHGAVAIRSKNNFVHQRFIKIFKNKVTRFIVVSNPIKPLLAQACNISPDKIEVVYNAIDHNKFSCQNASRQKIRHQLNISDDEPVLGFTGRLVYNKGIDLVPDILNSLHTMGYKVHFILAGCGDLENEIKEKTGKYGLSQYLHLTGFRSDIPDIISAFDIAVHPSRFEPFGISVLEYFAMGVPAVCSNAAGLSDIARNMETALIVQQHSADAFAQSISQLLQDKNLCENISSRAMAFSKNFTIEKYTGTIRRLYRKTKT